MRVLPIVSLRTWGVVLISMAALAACAAPSANPIVPTVPPKIQPTQPPSVLPTQPPSPLSPDANTVGTPVAAARADLAQQLNVDPDTIVVVSNEQVDWPDACMGIQTPDVMCAQVITPGYKIILEVDGKQYEYHTNASGSVVRLAQM